MNIFADRRSNNNYYVGQTIRFRGVSVVIEAVEGFGIRVRTPTGTQSIYFTDLN